MCIRDRDEATASLDVDNETLIQESLSKLIRNKTVMIIAHRMRTVADADKIVVLKDGVVAEQGTPAELEANCLLYTSQCRNRHFPVQGKDADSDQRRGNAGSYQFRNKMGKRTCLI